MKMIIQRLNEIYDGTIGEFSLIDEGRILLKGYTLEPKGKDTTQRNQDRRIPAGLYNVTWHFSPRFKRSLPLLYNELVPQDRYILIHAGNYPKDTEGCILLGKRATSEGVFNSLEALREFLAIVRNREFKVEIRNI